MACVANVVVTSSVPQLPAHIQTKMRPATTTSAAAASADDAAALPPASDAVCTVTFDMSPVAAPIANLLRRLILTEVPTMAFDRVLIDENDTPVYDEMLCQRLGMVPLACSGIDKFEFVTSESTAGQNLYTNATKVLRFDLDVSVPLDAPLHAVHSVYAGQLTWVPLPGQEGMTVRVVHPELLLAKIGCGQRLKLQVFALKGIGLTHAKWAPVSACYYEMLTEVKLLKPLTGDKAQQLAKLVPKVFGVERDPDGGKDDASAVRAVVLKDVAFQDCSRLFQDGVDFTEFVSVEKVKDAVRFTYETLGQYTDPLAVVGLALTLFAERLRYLKTRVERTAISNADKFETAAQSAAD